MIELETERLLLRPFQLTDWDELNALLSDPEVIRYMHFNSWTEEKRYKWLVWCVENNELANPDAYNWAITLRASTLLIGWLGIGAASHPTIAGERDFGYALHRDFWGLGYMPEALAAVLRFEFEQLKTPRIYGECELENSASARVMEKAGMRHKGVFLDADFEGNRRQRHRYAIDPQEFEATALAGG